MQILSTSDQPRGKERQSKQFFNTHGRPHHQRIRNSRDISINDDGDIELCIYKNISTCDDYANACDTYGNVLDNSDVWNGKEGYLADSDDDNKKYNCNQLDVNIL